MNDDRGQAADALRNATAPTADDGYRASDVERLFADLARATEQRRPLAPIIRAATLTPEHGGPARQNVDAVLTALTELDHSDPAAPLAIGLVARHLSQAHLVGLDVSLGDDVPLEPDGLDGPDPGMNPLQREIVGLIAGRMASWLERQSFPRPGPNEIGYDAEGVEKVRRELTAFLRTGELDGPEPELRSYLVDAARPGQGYDKDPVEEALANFGGGYGSRVKRARVSARMDTPPPALPARPPEPPGVLTGRDARIADVVGLVVLIAFLTWRVWGLFLR